MVAWGPIIGAGISAIGSLFGGDDDEETETTINYKKMARMAEQAGFNPLTAIRNGGSAGFTTTHHPGLSMSDRFGQAFQTIGNAIMSFDARADERAELEQQLLKAQIGQINRQGGASQRLWSFEVPQAAGSTRSTKAATGGAGAGGGAGYYTNTDLGATPKPENEPVTELDDVVQSTQQVVTAVKDAWRKDPGRLWWERLKQSDVKAKPPSWDDFKIPGVRNFGDSPRHWNLPWNRGW